EIANGKYLAFLDSDDLWNKEKLAIQVEIMKNRNYEFTYTSYELINESGKKLEKVINSIPKVSYKELLHGNPIGCLTVMIDREKIKNIHMPSIGHEDYATWLNILKRGYNAFGINQSLALHRISDNSLSSNKIK